MLPPLFLLAAISSLFFAVQAVTPANVDDDTSLSRRDETGETLPWDSGLSPDEPSNPSTVTAYITQIISACTSTVTATETNNNAPSSQPEKAVAGPSPSRTNPLGHLLSRIPPSPTNKGPGGPFEFGRPVMPERPF